MQQYGLANYGRYVEFVSRKIKQQTARNAAKYIITPSERDHKYSFGALAVFADSAQYLTANGGAKSASRDSPISTK
jgi:NAD(P)H-hydrate repair Nnr-like enzyme with NAD(P)H-hydrate dehydratase domain